MGTRYLIDTSVYSRYITSVLSEKGADILENLTESNILVATKIELLSWVTNAEVEEAVEDFVNDSEIFDLSEVIIQKTIQIRRESKIKLCTIAVAAITASGNFIFDSRLI